MKTNQKAELKSKTIEELNSALNEAEKSLRQTHVNFTAGKEKNLRILKAKRAEIAVLKTIMREKQLEANNG